MEVKKLIIGFTYLFNGQEHILTGDELGDILRIGGEFNYEPMPICGDFLLKKGFLQESQWSFRYKNIKVWEDSFNGDWYFVIKQSRAQHITIKIKYAHQVNIGLEFTQAGGV